MGMAERWITSHRSQLERGRAAVFGVVIRETNELCGVVGLDVYPNHNRAELGYWIGNPYWGQGFCTEACRGVLEWAFDALELHRIESRHFACNPASGRVMQKIGMKQEGYLRGAMLKWDQYEDLVIYGLLAEEWAQSSRA
jgi:RimJ/RimL family protein N-acetyltransferase